MIVGVGSGSGIVTREPESVIVVGVGSGLLVVGAGFGSELELDVGVSRHGERVELYVAQPSANAGQEYHVDTHRSEVCREGGGVVLSGKGRSVIGALMVVNCSNGVVLGYCVTV